MDDWRKLSRQARADISAAAEAWKQVLSERLDSRLVCAYAKGSAFKPWSSPIDYVPIISDIDIHVILDEGVSIVQTEDSTMKRRYETPSNFPEFDNALSLSEAFENKFLELSPEHLHIPRSQVMVVNRIRDIIEYVPPKASEVHILHGTLEEEPIPSNDSVRRIDLKNLLSLEEYIERMPRRVWDRTGIDYWTLIREMTFRVSPSPVRVLSQSTSDPYAIWSLNRTKIAGKLRKEGLDHIASSYEEFYIGGWQLFLSGFEDSDAYRRTVSGGYYTLRHCFDEARQLESTMEEQ